MQARQPPPQILDRLAPPPDAVLRYGDDPAQVVDLYLPLAWTGELALVVVVHGGFWKAEYDRQHVRPMCVALAAGGFAVASIEYRRVGQVGGGWPGTLKDVARAVARAPELVREITGPRTEVSRCVLLGHSAGGHLAAWCATRTPGASEPRGGRASREQPGVVALAGVLDLVAAEQLGLGNHAVRGLLGGSASEVPRRYAAADPLGPRRGAVLRLLHGADDDVVPVALSESYVERGVALGHDVTLRVLPDVEHFAVIDPTSSAWPAVWAAVRDVAARRGG